MAAASHRGVHGDPATLGANTTLESTAGGQISLSTVNGRVEIGARATSGDAETVNGRIEVGEGARVGDLSTVNGRIELGRQVQVDGDVETVNGSVFIDHGGVVDGSIATVNGGIGLVATQVHGGIDMVNGDLTVGIDSHVRGNVRYQKPRSMFLGIGRKSLLAAAYEHAVPIYTSSPGDSSIGMNVAAKALQGSKLLFDVNADVNETAAIVLDAKRSGGRLPGGRGFTAGPASGGLHRLPRVVVRVGERNDLLIESQVEEQGAGLALASGFNFGKGYVQNVTDVDEPLLERAERDGVDWQELAAGQIDLFFEDMEALRVIPPDHYVGAQVGYPTPYRPPP